MTHHAPLLLSPNPSIIASVNDVTIVEPLNRLLFVKRLLGVIRINTNIYTYNTIQVTSPSEVWPSAFFNTNHGELMPRTVKRARIAVYAASTSVSLLS